MSQHPYTIPNQLAPAARTDINNALKALASTNSGTTAPSVPYANQLWYDTSTDTLKVRNEANNAWFSLGLVNQSTGKFEPNQTTASVSETIAGSTNNPVTPPSLVGSFLPLLQFFQPTSANSIRLSNGLIVQWGQWSHTGAENSSQTNYLGTAYPSGHIGTFLSPDRSSFTAFGVANKTSNSFDVVKGGSPGNFYGDYLSLGF